MDIKEEELLGGSAADHWYYRSKQLALDSMLSDVAFRRVLDVGAGSAVFSKHLLDLGADSAVCVDSAYDVDHADSHDGKTIEFVREVVPCDADLVLLMDVIEHVDDDVALIRSSVAGVSSGASVLISVPAFQFLYSAHDRFLDHRRRYTVHSLEQVVAAAGLHVVTARYFFSFILPIVAAVRYFQRDAEPRSSLTRHSRFVNAILTAAHRIELPLFRYNRLGGLSIFCLARVP